ncbi:hypothetical protein [Achromobacter xylosoxidans]|uniref:Uncharacterized protein n=1 Tax=Achromobacter phage JWX TaxID=1589746 RepID=A0A0B5A1R5_9CAUD|nr:hypothetical protein [Achromobacter xylosoxidans]YP_009196242.1 hypothetical protein AVV28_gp59 [Achromobacter phage JWX]AJD82823.1 hypothetical protein JWX_00058 [Achromobacter phage JWX]WLW38476.1 hypothetical protein JWT_00053 [Achromobacter phage JWT]
MNKHSKKGKDPRTCRVLDELCNKNAKRKGVLWTFCEQHDLQRAWERGLSVGSIGLIHGRTAGAIASRLRQMRLIDDKIYMNFGLFPDFTIEMCGARSKVEGLIRMGLMCSTGCSELVAEIPRERRWPQAEAYMGYVPGATVGMNIGMTPLEFYYPQALAKSAIGPMIREGRLDHNGGVPTWNLKDMCRNHFHKPDEALHNAMGIADRLDERSRNLPKATHAGRGGGKSVLMVPDVGVRIRDEEGTVVQIGSLVDWYELTPEVITSSYFKQALQNAGFQLQALDVKSSQCVNEHAANQEQEMKEKIQSAINLLETGVKYPKVRFIGTEDSGREYTYKHRGDVKVGDFAVVVVPNGHVKLVQVIGFDDAANLQSNVRYKWLVQVINMDSYEELVGREDAARENLRMTIADRARKEQLNNLLGELGDSPRVNAAMELLSPTSIDKALDNSLDYAFKAAEARLKAVAEADPSKAEQIGKVLEVAKTLRELTKPAGGVAGVPGMVD